MKDELVSVQVALDGTFALDAAPHQRMPVADTSHHTSDAPTDPVVHALRSARLLSSSSTSDIVLALSVFGQLGVLIRYALSLPSAPFFRTLYANILGSFLMACLCDGKAAAALFLVQPLATPGYRHSAALLTEAARLREAPLALYIRSPALNRSKALLVGMRTGLCGCMTTLSSWNKSAYTLLLNGQISGAICAYLFGFLLALCALQLGQRLALAVWLAQQPKVGLEGVGGAGIGGSAGEKPTADTRIACVLRSLAIGLLMSTTLLAFTAPFRHTIPLRILWLSLLFSPIGSLWRWRLSKLNSAGAANLPLGTLLANAIAVAALAMLEGASEGTLAEDLLRRDVLAALGTELCGSLSTVSTFVLEVNERLIPLLRAVAQRGVRGQAEDAVQMRCNDNVKGPVYILLTLGLCGSLGVMITFVGRSRIWYN